MTGKSTDSFRCVELLDTVLLLKTSLQVWETNTETLRLRITLTYTGSETSLLLSKHLSWSPLLNHFVKLRVVKIPRSCTSFFLLNYLNVVHTNCLISSSKLRTGLLEFWPKCQHRFLVITFLVNFCHTNCFISEFHFWFLEGGLTSLLHNKPDSEKENRCYLVDKTTVSRWSVDFTITHDPADTKCLPLEHTHIHVPQMEFPIQMVLWKTRSGPNNPLDHIAKRNTFNTPSQPQPCHYREEVMKPEWPTPKNELVIDVILNNTWWHFRPVVVWNRIHPLW
jgi:hypothetical protein